MTIVSIAAKDLNVIEFPVNSVNSSKKTVLKSPYSIVALIFIYYLGSYPHTTTIIHLFQCCLPLLVPMQLLACHQKGKGYLLATPQTSFLCESVFCLTCFYCSAAGDTHLFSLNVKWNLSLGFVASTVILLQNTQV